MEKVMQNSQQEQCHTNHNGSIMMMSPRVCPNTQYIMQKNIYNVQFFFLRPSALLHAISPLTH